MESEHSIDGRKGLRAQNKQNFDVPSSSESEDDQDDESELEDPGTESEEEKEDEDEEDEDGGKSVEAASQPPPSATKLFRCPLASLAKCKCLAKTLESVREIKLYILDINTIAVHDAAKDYCKHLNMDQRRLVADAVEIAPHQTASDLMRTKKIQHSPTKKIQHVLCVATRKVSND
jgi:hypothetical protein